MLHSITFINKPLVAVSLSNITVLSDFDLNMSLSLHFFFCLSLCLTHSAAGGKCFSSPPPPPLFFFVFLSSLNGFGFNVFSECFHPSFVEYYSSEVDLCGRRESVRLRYYCALVVMFVELV